MILLMLSGAESDGSRRRLGAFSSTFADLPVSHKNRQSSPVALSKTEKSLCHESRFGSSPELIREKSFGWWHWSGLSPWFVERAEER